jgi:hypothetical protein
MVKKGELKLVHFSSTAPEIYFLPTTTAIREYRVKHEKLCGDLYVVYELTGCLDYWYAPEDYDSYGLKPDRQMIYLGKLVFWEVDRGTEDYFTAKGIKGKLDKYVQLSKDNHQRRFYVIITTIDNKQTALKRCETILELITTYNRADQFMTSTHEWVMNHPDKSPFLTPNNLMGVSIPAAK